MKGYVNLSYFENQNEKCMDSQEKEKELTLIVDFLESLIDEKIDSKNYTYTTSSVGFNQWDYTKREANIKLDIEYSKDGFANGVNLNPLVQGVPVRVDDKNDVFNRDAPPEFHFIENSLRMRYFEKGWGDPESVMTNLMCCELRYSITNNHLHFDVQLSQLTDKQRNPRFEKYQNELKEIQKKEKSLGGRIKSFFENL